MKIPSGEHWAIITTSSYTVPGDERSRAQPGHGYSEHTVETINYEAFTDFARFEQSVINRTNRNEWFTAAKVNPLQVEKKVTIQIK